jgi:hypothetical protein
MLCILISHVGIDKMKTIQWFEGGGGGCGQCKTGVDFDCEYLSEFEAKLAKALAVVKETYAHPINTFTQKNRKIGPVCH